ncbi:MAG TPA: S9 family peptidase [Acidimicrobiia bacterium]|nr:S9 family peptidase [Acidimicrobiia bacterium]
MKSKPWLGKDEYGGVPSHVLPDRVPAPHWRLDAIYAVERPIDPAIAPDGSRVAFVLSSGAENDVHVVDLAGGQSRRLTTHRAPTAFWEDRGPKWSPDGSRVAYQSDGDTFVVASDGGPPTRIEDVSVEDWLDDQSLVVVVERDRSTRLATVEVADPWPQPFGPSGGDVSGAQVTEDGRVVAVFWPVDDRNRTDIFVADPGGRWRTLAGYPDRRARDPAINGDRVAYTLEDGDWRAVYLTDLDGSEHRLLAKEDADFHGLAWSRDGRTLAASRLRRGQGDLVTIHMEGTVTTLSPGGLWESPRWSDRGVIAVHEAHDSPPRLLIVGDQPITLYDGAPAAVAAAPHVGFERITFDSGDGLEIEGFLFRPAEISGQVPAVVYPHGGPTLAYGDEWDGHAQYFVDKGYAWLSINYRGSTTYGVPFERANHDDWGVGDTADCIAAGRYLAGQDWVDADRIAIFGASYGSYLALTSLVHPDNPFACGVAKYGDCNILTSWAQGDRPGRDDLERMMDHPSENRSAYHAGSPIHRIERLDRPILVAHGERDARVHVEQSRELIAALERLGKTYEYITYPEEGHGLLRRESHLHFHRRLERFLDWYLL